MTLEGTPRPRRAIVEIHASLLVAMCKPGPAMRLGAHPIPADAVAVGARYDAARDVWELVVESRAFDRVPDGQPYPVLPAPLFVALGDG